MKPPFNFDSIKDKIYLKQDLNWLKQRYWVTGDGLTKTILTIERRFVLIRAEP
jgi:hypothetical protein